MRSSFTAVVARNERITDVLETEPYECAWASEARWFVRVLEKDGADGTLELQTQLSADGLFWCDAEAPALRIDEEGLYTQSVSDFGGWMRFRGRVLGRGAAFVVVISLALKE